MNGLNSNILLIHHSRRKKSELEQELKLTDEDIQKTTHEQFE